MRLRKCYVQVALPASPPAFTGAPASFYRRPRQFLLASPPVFTGVPASVTQFLQGMQGNLPEEMPGVAQSYSEEKRKRKTEVTKVKRFLGLTMSRWQARHGYRRFRQCFLCRVKVAP